MADKIDLEVSKVSVDISVSGKDQRIDLPQKKAGQRVGLSIDRATWTDPTQRLRAALLVSADNGKTWREWCSYEDQGGEQLGPNKEPLPLSTFVATPPPEGLLVRASVTEPGKPTSTLTQAVSFVEML